jgi:anti-sigma regulatory factor (Ser/Thr protein kinase)
VRTCLYQWGLSAQADVLVLVVSELMTNAVLYGSGEIEVRMSLDGPDLLLEVSDRATGSGLVRSSAAASDGAEGWRLRIVEMLVDRWGASRGPQGTTVWVRRAVGRRGGLDDVGT